MRSAVRQRYRGVVIAWVWGEPFWAALWYCGVWNFMADEADRRWR